MVGKVWVVGKWLEMSWCVRYSTLKSHLILEKVCTSMKIILIFTNQNLDFNPSKLNNWEVSIPLHVYAPYASALSGKHGIWAGSISSYTVTRLYPLGYLGIQRTIDLANEFQCCSKNLFASLRTEVLCVFLFYHILQMGSTLDLPSLLMVRRRQLQF